MILVAFENKVGNPMSHYETLGIPSNADLTAIKKAYKKLSLKNHPDRGGDTCEFQKISEAYGVLSDPEQKRAYDNPFASIFSGQGFFDTANSSSEPAFFANLFGGIPGGIPFQPPQQQQQQHRNINMNHKVLLTLEDFYSGKNCKFAVSRKETCQECEGEGGWGKKELDCIGCNGQGVRVSQRGFNSVSRSTCIKCHGKGKSVIFEKMCKSCKTMGTTTQRLVVEAKFEPGSLPGDRVILKGMSDCVKGSPPGDVIVTATEKSHRIFKRKLNTLKCSIDITLRQSLCGFSAEITHLDGRSLEVKSAPYTVTPHGHKIVLHGEGIPKGKGCLEITTNVIFPSSNVLVPESIAAQLEQCLDVLEKH